MNSVFATTVPQTIQMSENTFILTLDGDVDFRPDSVRLLLDRMKKNKKVGAVCGRIHPIGSGQFITSFAFVSVGPSTASILNPACQRPALFSY